jgi:hypothetical protein
VNRKDKSAQKGGCRKARTGQGNGRCHCGFPMLDMFFYEAIKSTSEQ